jgi:hypothetical protein
MKTSQDDGMNCSNINTGYQFNMLYELKRERKTFCERDERTVHSIRQSEGNKSLVALTFCNFNDSQRSTVLLH